MSGKIKVCLVTSGVDRLSAGTAEAISEFADFCAKRCETPEALLETFPDAEVLWMFGPNLCLKPEALDRMLGVKALMRSGSGLDALPVDWAKAHGVGVTSAMVQIPWCCDIGGTSIGRNHGEWYVQWVPALGYYDPANMARLIPKGCRVAITHAGIGDYTCPPTGVAVFYNNLKCSKMIKWSQGATHGYTPPERDTFVMERK